MERKIAVGIGNADDAHCNSCPFCRSRHQSKYKPLCLWFGCAILTRYNETAERCQECLDAEIKEDVE